MSLRAEILRLGTRCLPEGQARSGGEPRGAPSACGGRGKALGAQPAAADQAHRGRRRRGLRRQWVVAPAAEPRPPHPLPAWRRLCDRLPGALPPFGRGGWRARPARGCWRSTTGSPRSTSSFPAAPVDDALAAYRMAAERGGRPMLPDGRRRLWRAAGSPLRCCCAAATRAGCRCRRQWRHCRRGPDLALTGASLRRNLVADPFLRCERDPADRGVLSRRRRSPAPVRLAALRRPRPGCRRHFDPGRQRRGAARRRDRHGPAAARRGVRGRAGGVAAHAACVAPVRHGDARGGGRAIARVGAFARERTAVTYGPAATRRSRPMSAKRAGSRRQAAVVPQLSASVPAEHRRAPSRPPALPPATRRIAAKSQRDSERGTSRKRPASIRRARPAAAR